MEFFSAEVGRQKKCKKLPAESVNDALTVCPAFIWVPDLSQFRGLAYQGVEQLETSVNIKMGWVILFQ